MKIAVIEDDERIGKNIKALLEDSNYVVDWQQSGEAGIDAICSEPPDLIILDWMLPDIDGPSVIQSIRQEDVAAPILMLTAKSQLNDFVSGLDAGADDYLTKPFRSEELLARIRALLRRRSPQKSSTITIADVTVNLATHQVERNGKPIALSPKEFSLLRYLILHQNVAATRIDIMTKVWGEDVDLFSNTVDVHIRYLRKKLGKKCAQHIQTVKGVGYILCVE